MANDKKIQPNLNGPESIPLRDHNQEFPMKVTVIDIKNDDKVLREETIDYANHEHRKWLGRVTYWACTNGYAVETMKA